MTIHSIDVITKKKKTRRWTAKELAKHQLAAKNKSDSITYDEKRRNGFEGKKGYQPVGDQLDAIMKQINHMRLNGTELIQEMDDALGHYLQVKKDFLKPEGSE